MRWAFHGCIRFVVTECTIVVELNMDWTWKWQKNGTKLRKTEFLRCRKRERENRAFLSRLATARSDSCSHTAMSICPVVCLSVDDRHPQTPPLSQIYPPYLTQKNRKKGLHTVKIQFSGSKWLLKVINDLFMSFLPCSSDHVQTRTMGLHTVKIWALRDTVKCRSKWLPKVKMAHSWALCPEAQRVYKTFSPYLVHTNWDYRAANKDFGSEG